MIDAKPTPTAPAGQVHTATLAHEYEPLKFNSTQSVEERFHSSYVRITETGCWVWMGAWAEAAPRDCRPRIQILGKAVSAYRLSYQMHIGEIPPKAMICHRCSVSMCVNPAHLYAGDSRTNYEDARALGRTGVQRYPEAARAAGMKLRELQKARGSRRGMKLKLTEEQRRKRSEWATAQNRSQAERAAALKQNWSSTDVYAGDELLDALILIADKTKAGAGYCTLHDIHAIAEAALSPASGGV